MASNKRNKKSAWRGLRWGGLLTLCLLASCDSGSRGAVLNALPMFTLTDAEEGRIGEEAEASLLVEHARIDAPVLQEVVDRLGGLLGEATERRAVRWRFHVIDEPAPNAFALPGGAIFLTRGAVVAMRDGAELVGVLAHEVAHVGLRHGATALQRQAILEGLTRAAVDDRSVVLVRLTQVAEGLARKGFSRDDERDADREALRLADRVGYAADGLEGFLDTLRDRLGDTHPALELLSDHPLLSERIATLRELRASLSLTGSRRDEQVFLQARKSIE